jgi:hypothetical protein
MAASSVPAPSGRGQRGGLVFEPGDGELWKARSQGFRGVGHEIGRDRRDHADPHGAGQRIAAAPRRLDEIARIHEQAPGALENLLARIGGHDPAPIPLEEAHAQAGFELRDLSAERGLRHVALLGGPPEASRVGHRHRVLELAQ